MSSDLPPAPGNGAAPSVAPYEPSLPPAQWSPPTREETVALRGELEPLPRGPFAIVEALLKAPARILHELRHGRGALLRLSLLLAATMAIAGVVMASFTGGWQLVIVPLKITGGVFFCALICLPSLYILSSLGGAAQTLRETWGALLMGIALMGVLLVGFAPITWVFSQATSSVAFMGALHLVALAISIFFGLSLVHRTLAAANGGRVKGRLLFNLLFVLVVLQMTTTLRPLVGEQRGGILQPRQFFLEHWGETLGS